MKPSTLPSPGNFTNGHKLRHEAAHAISQLEIVAAKSPSTVGDRATAMQDFFLACAAACTDLIQEAPPEE